ncbi:MAG TPA: DarT ssDNA thymidine ADP-ribosyltransferase family protein [Phycisphaerae bacterium]|nr:DarT ssDNA thymidine ADP-ribosyltransferase family protein [Phycisphaerae bacterium]
MARRAEIKGLFYITHIENVPSILKNGILSHDLVNSLQIPYKPIYDADIVSNRKNKATPERASLWEYANIYFQPRNPMMYRVVHEKTAKDLAVIGIKPSILQLQHVMITDGNAANNPTRFFNVQDGLKVIDDQWMIIQAEYWNDLNGSKRKIMSECLVPERIPSEYIYTVFVADHEARKRIEGMIGLTTMPIVPEPNMFFKPYFVAKIGKNISLVEGDMFFSGMQTLTVSVNLQGIMGKGLASRAKYQFPDVYVYYQDACRAKRVTATKPAIYKREASLDAELADLTTPLTTPNAIKWFLLFATKRKWRDNSRMDDIEAGLAWFRDHFKSEGVQSIALPALGCGLGGLDWANVGPLMCKYLHGIGIDVAIYLPREKQIDSKFLSQNYLLQGAG